jgi:chemotaxis protein methyltransferase CheR
MPGDGMLYLGGAETVLGITSRFAPMPAERGVYGLTASMASSKALASG